MIVVAIESATDSAGVAIAGDDGISASFGCAGRRRHNETLAPALAHLFASTGFKPSDLGAVVVDVGPGLFTGLRVGVALAKGLAKGLAIGVVALGSTEVLARAAFEAGWPGEVLAVVDARRGEVFVARYGLDAGLPKELAPARRFRPEELAHAVADLDQGPLLCVGDGARRYADLLAAAKAEVAGPLLAAPDAAVAARIGLERLSAGEVPVPPGEVAVRYLRDADVRINWTVRTGAGER